MNLVTEDREALFKALEGEGWFWDGNFIYAPQRTMWLLGADPWQESLEDFYERMSARVHRIIRHKAYHPSPQQHQHCVEDTESSVASLRKLLEAKRGI